MAWAKVSRVSNDLLELTLLSLASPTENRAGLYSTGWIEFARSLPYCWIRLRFPSCFSVGITLASVGDPQFSNQVLQNIRNLPDRCVQIARNRAEGCIQ